MKLLLYIMLIGGGGVACFVRTHNRKIRIFTEDRLSRSLKLYVEKENREAVKTEKI